MPVVSSLLAHSSSVIHLDDGSIPVSQLADDGPRLAGWFEEFGLGPGDRIAIWASNGLPYLRCLAATAAGRFVAMSVNSRFSEAEAWSIIERCGAKVVVTDRAVGNGSGVTVLATTDIAQGMGHAPTQAIAVPDDPFVAFTTSGTTSKPKLVLHTQRSIVDHAHDAARPFGYGTEARVMVALPLCGVFGICAFTSAVAGGSQVWLPGAFDVEETSAVIATERITSMNGPDDMFHRMLATDHDLSSVAIGGYAKFNSSLRDIVVQAEKRGVVLTGLYGMSEVQALFSIQDPTQPAELREAGGGAPVSARAGARVVDPESGELAATGAEGELQLFGPSLFAGYLAEGGASIDEDLTESNHVVDDAGQRWFKTGDLARMEPDGSFTYLTRMGDVLRLGGFLVAPSQIEDVLIELDSIAEAQVVTVARPEGVRPVAIVIPATTGVSVDEAAAQAHCREHLAKFKVPIRIIEVDAFPVTLSANGTKIQRNKLQELAEQALTAG